MKEILPLEGSGMPKRRDLTGQRFGSLTAVSSTEKDKAGKYLWICKCDCGKEVIADIGRLTSGNTTSCGCSRIKHGASATKTYFAWRSMRNRCESPSSHSYKWYGARGINVCERWSSFEAFLEDMGEVPLGMTLDREDNDKGYYKENCRWVTQAVQARNSRQNRTLTVNGQTKCISEWARHFGINLRTIFYRLRANWPVEKLFEPINENLSRSR